MSGSVPTRFHHCIAVPDLEQSIGFFAENFGGGFQPVRTLPMTVVSGTISESVDVSFAFSLDGRLELLQTVPGEGLFADDSARGFHHIGYQLPNPLQVTVDELTASGETRIAEIFLGETPIAVFFAPTPARPVRLEILSPNLGNNARTE